jgi:hypothetical protein
VGSNHFSGNAVLKTSEESLPASLLKRWIRDRPGLFTSPKTVILLEVRLYSITINPEGSSMCGAQLVSLS